MATGSLGRVEAALHRVLQRRPAAGLQCREVLRQAAWRPRPPGYPLLAAEPRAPAGSSCSQASRLPDGARRRASGAAAAEVEAPPHGTELSFGDARLAFESRTTFELLRAWLIFKTCSFGWIVRNCDKLYGYSLRFLGSRLTHGVLRHTLFNHFCAGESASEIIPRMEQLRRYGVGGILDYAAEAKDDALPRAQHPEDEASTVGAPLSARTYQYSGEALCDANAEIFMDAIRAVRDATPDGFAAVKLSGLGDPHLLERMSTCLVEMTFFFLQLGADESAAQAARSRPYYCLDRSGKIDWQTFSRGWQKAFHVDNMEELQRTFNQLDSDKDGMITFVEWSENVRLSEINELAKKCIQQGRLYRSALDEEEKKLYWNLIDRLRRIMDLAESLGVRVMVDAEWMDIQPAIDHLVIFLQRKYNTGDRPIVFQTYQTYLKGMHASVLHDLGRSAREGWYFGAKVVRGAYMVSERQKAQARGLESPVCETYEETEANFHDTIASILHHNPKPAGSGPGQAEAELLIASHNRGSIEFAIRELRASSRDSTRVYFGQLLGMADHLTFTLARNGYKAYKYVPYGPIDEVVPYLIRRTQENSAILGSPGVQEERAMVTSELGRRLWPF